MADAEPEGGKRINLSDLPIPQLAQLKQELEQELRQRQSQYEVLASAKSRFEATRTTMEKLRETEGESRSILVPMTQSIYQSGELVDNERFIMDIGAGYLVERNYKANRDYVDKRIKQVQDSLDACLSQLVQRKKVQEMVLLTLQAKVGVEAGQPAPVS